jgi:hypothetical protein
VVSLACILSLATIAGCSQAKPQASDSGFCRDVEGILKGAFDSPEPTKILSKLRAVKPKDLDPDHRKNFAALVADFAAQLSKASVAPLGGEGWSLDPIAKFASGICKKEIVGISAVP